LEAAGCTGFAIGQKGKWGLFLNLLYDIIFISQIYSNIL